MLELAAVPDLLAKLLASPRDVVLIALLVAAAVIDWRTYKIPNWLTVGGMVFGLLYNASADAVMPGFWLALAGLGAGLVVLLPLYALRVMGAGDVKLMAAVGAFVGWPSVLYAVLFTFIAGGIAAVAIAIWRGALIRMVANVGSLVRFVSFPAGERPALVAGGSIGRMPYGLSICVGTIAWMVVRQLG